VRENEATNFYKNGKRPDVIKEWSGVWRVGAYKRERICLNYKKEGVLTPFCEQALELYVPRGGEAPVKAASKFRGEKPS